MKKEIDALAKVSCVEIEVAIMREFDFRRKLIVSGVTNMMGLVAFETDMIVLSESNYAYGFEIKTSRSDLRAEFKKRQHTHLEVMLNGKTGKERYYGKFKYFYYAVPEQLKELALELIPPFCGLWVYRKPLHPLLPKFYKAKEASMLFNYKWTIDQRYELARLGAMRVFALKEGVIARG